MTEEFLTAGCSPRDAKVALLLLHGRGSNSRDIMSLYESLRRDDVHAIAPQARGGAWYPKSFLAPISENQPELDEALDRVNSLIVNLSQSVSLQRIVVAGFSQGACLACEFCARFPREYGALVAFTGGLIGAPGQLASHTGSLDRSRVLLAAGDPDPHVPFSRVLETAETFQRMSASVEVKRFPNMPHMVNEEELRIFGKLVDSIAGKTL